MNIAIDYDDTYTRDPLMWVNIIAFFKRRGHMVYCVTSRSYHASSPVIIDLGNKVDEIYYTNGKAKQPFMFAQGIRIDVWIDDNPLSIVDIPLIGM